MYNGSKFVLYNLTSIFFDLLKVMVYLMSRPVLLIALILSLVFFAKTGVDLGFIHAGDVQQKSSQTQLKSKAASTSSLN